MSTKGGSVHSFKVGDVVWSGASDTRKMCVVDRVGKGLIFAEGVVSVRFPNGRYQLFNYQELSYPTQEEVVVWRLSNDLPLT